jgi:hypothetical protein
MFMAVTLNLKLISIGKDRAERMPNKQTQSSPLMAVIMIHVRAKPAQMHAMQSIGIDIRSMVIMEWRAATCCNLHTFDE